MRGEGPVPRFQSSAVEESLADTRVVVVHGARERFRDKVSDHDVIGVVFHGGKTVQVLHDWIYVLPVQALWELD